MLYQSFATIFCLSRLKIFTRPIILKKTASFVFILLIIFTLVLLQIIFNDIWFSWGNIKTWYVRFITSYYCRNIAVFLVIKLFQDFLVYVMRYIFVSFIYTELIIKPIFYMKIMKLKNFNVTLVRIYLRIIIIHYFLNYNSIFITFRSIEF